MPRTPPPDAPAPDAPPRLGKRARRALETFTALQRAAALAGHGVERALDGVDLTGSQMGVLEVLEARGPLHQQELAETLARSKAQMTAILDVLEKRGFVRRERRTDDRRFIQVELLAAGRGALAAAQPVKLAAVQEALRGLDAKQRRRLGKLARRLARALAPESPPEPAATEPAAPEQVVAEPAAPEPVATADADPAEPAPAAAAFPDTGDAAPASSFPDSSAVSAPAAPADLGFVHRFLPRRDDGPRVALLLLHGTGGNEDDLLPLADLIASGAAVLSPRGRSLDEGAPRFFRRLAEGVFDQADLERRTHELATFVHAAREHYAIADLPMIAVGFSNGANIASSLLLRHPGLLRGALLLRGMVPFTPPAPPALPGTDITLANGSHDPIVPREQPEQLAELFRAGGATVRLEWLPAGHQLTSADVQLGRDLVRAVAG